MTRASVVRRGLITLAIALTAAPAWAQTPIAFVQRNYAVPQTPQATVTVRYTAAQRAGSLNVVIIGWNDVTAHVLSVTDSTGNTYRAALQPTVQPGIQSMVIYYASNIAAAAANANVVTVRFDAAADFPDVRVAEYAGLDLTDPLDVAKGASGTGSPSNSGSATTTAPRGLLVAGNYVQTTTTGAGTGFTRRVTTSPDGNVLEDRVVNAPGTYSATAPVQGGGWVMQMVAFRGVTGTADTQPPTAPSNLSASAISSTQINLSWTASTDNVAVTGYRVERCQGAGCTTFAQVGTPTATSFNDTGLTPATAYTYRVRAVDAVPNFSGYSPTASATTMSTPDTQPPTAPASLTATAASSAQIDLAWSASTDNVSVTGYQVERCQGGGCTTFVQIATPTQTTFSDTGLTESTSYSYRVRATDAAQNPAGYSPTASATTQTTAPPSFAFVQSNYAVPQTPQSTVAVAYTQAQTAGNLNFVAIGWNDATSHVISVSDTNGNVYQPALAPTVQPGIQTHVIYYAPNIAAAAAGTNTVTVQFDAAASFPDVRVAEYFGIDRTSPVMAASGAFGTGSPGSSGATPVSTAPALLVAANYVQTSTTGPGAGFTQRIITNPDGNILQDSIVSTPGDYSATAPVQGAGWVMQLVAFRPVSTSTDTEPPTAPVLWATVVSSTEVNLWWSASTDNVGVAGYQVERCQGSGCTTFTQIAAPSGLIFNDTGLTPATTYVYRVRAVDAVPNPGPYSSALTRTTASTVDTEPPAAPATLTATATSSSQINLTWTAATDNVGVTGYRVERCAGAGCTFTQIATPGGTTFNDTGLTPSTGYTYRVRAADAASNLSDYSPNASATTQPATPPPSFAFVQSAYAVPQTPQSTVTVTYTQAQTAGNLNFIAIGWNDATSHVQSVTDSKGNLYQIAIAPTVQPGIQSQVIYYARNIVAAAATTNIVTVRFDAAASYPDVRIAEYRGIDPNNPVMAASGAFGTGSPSSSGAATASTGPAFLVAANYVQTMTTGPGSGFTQRLITNPDGNILEDRIVTTAGSYTATAPVQGAGWVMQLVAFRAIAGPPDTEPPTPPTNLTATPNPSGQIDLAWTASTDNVGVTGYRVERCQGAGCTIFGQIATPNASPFGDITVVGATSYTYQIRAIDGAGNLSPFSAQVSATTLSTPPFTVTVSAPAAGSTLSGTVTLSAIVNRPNVAGVQFQVDGVNVGPASGAPYTITFNTAGFGNGTHAITAYAWDALRAFATSPAVAVTFSNTTPGNPSQKGLWSGRFNWPLVAVHVNLMRDGRVLAWDKMDTGNINPMVWDPQTSGFTTVPTDDWVNIFCAGHVTLGDGRVLVVGGHADDHVGLRIGRIFDPATNQWSTTSDMAYPRWYPTLTTLPDGRVLTLAGEVNCRGCDAEIPEIYNPATNTWTQLTGARLKIPYYPHVFVLPNGKVVVTGTAEDPFPASVLDVATQTWTTVDSRLFDAYSSAMYLPGKILKTGTSTDTLSGATQSSRNAYVIDMNSPTPAWRQIASMAFARTYHVETLLPDGTILVTGGGTTTGDYDVDNAVLAPELWSPVTETFATMNAGLSPRLYHGTALLLPDGRVLVSGGGRSPGPDSRDQENAEIFAPPYLFKGPRPVIAAAPADLVHNQTFTVQTPDASRIAKVTLVAIGNMTHGINMNQRYLPLSFTVESGNLSVTAPANTALAPPGIYMLFLVDTAGVPSVASFVRF